MTGYPSCPRGIALIDPAQEKKVEERSYKVRNFWTMLATESQKAAEDSPKKKIKKKLNDSLGFIVLQAQFALKINKSFLILINAISFFYIINPSLTKPRDYKL